MCKSQDSSFKNTKTKIQVIEVENYRNTIHFKKIADIFDLADNQILEIAKIVREFYGRNSIEPNLRMHLKDHGKEADEYFEAIKIPFDIHYKDKETKQTTTVEEERYLVYCKNVEDWENFVKKEREIDLDENAKHKRTIYLDGGGDHFKICANLVEEKIKSNAPMNPKKIKRRYKDSSVKATYLLAKFITIR